MHGDAVEAAAFHDEVFAGDGDDLAAWEAFGDLVFGDLVLLLLAEDGDHDAVVEHHEVRIAGGQTAETPVFDLDGVGHFDLDDLQLAAIGGADVVELLADLLEDFEVGVGLFGLDHADHGVFTDEADDVIDVAVGVVAFDAFFEPDDVGHAEHGLEFFLDLGLVARFAAVAVGIEQDGLGGEEQAFAVGFDGTALKNHVGGEALHFQGSRRLFRDQVVEFIGELAAPGVELPVGDGELAGFVVLDKNRAVVAAPNVVGAVLVDVHLAEIALVVGDAEADVHVAEHRCIDAHALVAGDGAGDLPKLVLQFVKGLRAALLVGGPRKPDCLLRFEFSGEVVVLGVSFTHRGSVWSGVRMCQCVDHEKTAKCGENLPRPASHRAR